MKKVEEVVKNAEKLLAEDRLPGPGAYEDDKHKV